MDKIIENGEVQNVILKKVNVQNKVANIEIKALANILTYSDKNSILDKLKDNKNHYFVSCKKSVNEDFEIYDKYEIYVTIYGALHLEKVITNKDKLKNLKSVIECMNKQKGKTLLYLDEVKSKKCKRIEKEMSKKKKNKEEIIDYFKETQKIFNDLYFDKMNNGKNVDIPSIIINCCNVCSSEYNIHNLWQNSYNILGKDRYRYKAFINFVKEEGFIKEFYYSLKKVAE